MKNFKENNHTEIAVCFVGDYQYLRKHYKNISNELKLVANYHGDILLITSFLTPTFLIKSIRREKKLTIFRFRKIKFSKYTSKIMSSLYNHNQPNRFLTKRFQWHKLHLFDLKIKKWKYIFYLDLNMHFHHEIKELLSLKPSNILYARADAYPSYDRNLISQFDETNDLFNDLQAEFKLDSVEYFQTGLLYFDTEIIENDTKNNLVELAERYPISITNEQGIMNLYFSNIKNQYKELPKKIGNKITYFYWMLESKEIIITKQLRTKYK